MAFEDDLKRKSALRAANTQGAMEAAERLKADFNTAGTRAAGNRLRGEFAQAADTAYNNQVAQHRAAIRNVPAQVPQAVPATQAEFEAARAAQAARMPAQVPQATMATQAEFDAARAARMNPGPLRAPTMNATVTELPAGALGSSRGDQLAAESMRRAQEASRAASRAAYAGPSAAQRATTAAAEAVTGAGSRLRGALGSAGSKAAGLAGRAGGVLALGLEANNVLSAENPGAELPRAGGRLAGAYIGAKAGGSLPGALRIPGMLVGGIAGYAGGQDAVDAMMGNSSTSNGPGVTPGLPQVGMDNNGVPILPTDASQLAALQSRLRPGGAPGAGGGGSGAGPSFSNVVGGETPYANQVLGSFNGRQITRGDAETIAGQLQGPVPGSAPAQREDPVQSALRAMLEGRNETQVGMINSRSSDINRYFDGLASQIKDLHGGARFQARGSLATKLLRLEEARAQALGQDQNALVNSQGNVVSDRNGNRSLRSNAGQTLAGIQNNELDNLTSMRNTDQTVGGSILRERLENIRAQDAAQREQSNDNSKLLLDQARARHTDPTTGKVDEAAAQADFNEVIKNVPGVVEGTTGTAQAVQAMSEYAGERDLRDLANQGSDRANDELLNFGPGSRLRRPTFGEAMDSNSDVTLGDFAYDLLPDALPFVESGTIAESTDGRVVRNRRLNETQRRNLLRKLQGK